MHIIFMANRFYFSGKVVDFRRLLAKLSGSQATLSEYINRNLH